MAGRSAGSVVPLSDTRPEAVAAHADLLRSASAQRRLALALSLSDSITMLARRAIRAAQPSLSHEEIGIRFVEIHYGRQLAAKVREALERLR